MMSIPTHLELERLRYWQGQRLQSRDFRDQTTIEAQLRWWHNRALHLAFGVRYGLTVSPVTSEGALIAFRVDCGVAYDCYGRELLLQRICEVPIPAVTSPEELFLLIRYKETAQFPQRGDLRAICPPCGSSLWREEPDFFWRRVSDVQVTDGVPVAQVSFNNQRAVLNQQFLVPLSRPLARPRIGSSATAPEGTAWEIWSESVTNDNGFIQHVPVGMQVTVDTSAAGFTETPCYFAWLEGTLWDKSNIEFFPVPLTHIDSAATKQFRFRLWMPQIPTLLGARVRAANVNFEQEFINFARQQKLYVCWLGIQPRVAETAKPRCMTVEEYECHTASKD